jgi:hypothetical protein
MFKKHGVKMGALFLVLICFVAFSFAIGWSDETGKAAGKSAEGCVDNAAGPIGQVPAATQQATSPSMGWMAPKATVGKPAPDFEATAYYDGAFKKVKLSDYAGKWVVLCFYPGDFTFV